MHTMELREDGAPRRRERPWTAKEHVLDDLELVELVREGDTDAFGALFERHWSCVHAAALRRCDNRADADDVTVMTFMRTLGSIGRGYGPTSCLRSYLIATTARVASDRHRGRRIREVPLEHAPEYDDHCDVIDGTFDGAGGDLALAFGRLPARWRHILWESYVVGRPVKEIAESMGLRPNTAAAIAYRARIGLREAYLATLADDAAQVVK